MFLIVWRRDWFQKMSFRTDVKEYAEQHNRLRKNMLCRQTVYVIVVNVTTWNKAAQCNMGNFFPMKL